MSAKLYDKKQEKQEGAELWRIEIDPKQAGAVYGGGVFAMFRGTREQALNEAAARLKGLDFAPGRVLLFRLDAEAKADGGGLMVLR